MSLSELRRKHHEKITKYLRELGINIEEVSKKDALKMIDDGKKGIYIVDGRTIEVSDFNQFEPE